LEVKSRSAVYICVTVDDAPATQGTFAEGINDSGQIVEYYGSCIGTKVTPVGRQRERNSPFFQSDGALIPLWVTLRAPVPVVQIA